MDSATVAAQTDGQGFEKKKKTYAYVVYVLYLIGLFTFIPYIAAVIVAYVARSASPPWLESHFTFQIRTFWMTLLWGVIGVITALVLIGYLFLLWVVILYLVRVIRGLILLNDGRPIPNPRSWLFG